MNRKELKKQSNISMRQFLRDYYDINEDEIERLYKLSHKEIKSVLSDVYHFEYPCVNFDDVDIDDILCGNVILVKDFGGHLAPYNNPILLLENDWRLKK